MIKACDLKKTSVIDIDGTPHIIQNISQQSPTARGGGTIYKVRFRNVSTKQKVDKTYRSDDAL
jgi:elongation factor P